jgi:transposase
MRGEESGQGLMLSLKTADQCVPQGHPIGRIKQLADAALRSIEPVLDEMYSRLGRPSIPPQRLLKASLLMALYTVRSERLLCEQLGYNFLFRYFLDMNMVEEPFDHSSFSRNRARLLAHEVAGEFFAAVLAQARALNLLSDEHFSVDGTQIEAWASRKSYRPKDPPTGGGDAGSGGGAEPGPTARLRDRYQSSTDAEARMYRKSKADKAQLCYLGNALMDNQHGLLADFTVGLADGFCERSQALGMLARLKRGALSVGADKAYDTAGFVAGCAAQGLEAHVAQNLKRHQRSALNPALLGTARYRASQRTRKRIEEIFGWFKTVANFRKSRYRGRALTELAAQLVATAYNLTRIAKLCPAP